MQGRTTGLQRSSTQPVEPTSHAGDQGPDRKCKFWNLMSHTLDAAGRKACNVG